MDVDGSDPIETGMVSFSMEGSLIGASGVMVVPLGRLDLSSAIFASKSVMEAMVEAARSSER